MTYTFKISLNDTDIWTDATPLWDDSLGISRDKEDKDIFFRRMFSGSLTFIRSDYEAIYGYENDDEIKIKVYQDGVEWWSGYFGKFDGEWDEDACTFTVEPTVDDDYTCLKHKGDDEYNILNVTTITSGDVVVDFSYYEFVECNDPARTIYYPSTTPTFGVSYSAGNYTFNDSVAPINALYGSRISDDVPAEAVTPNWNRNISACGCLPDQGQSVAEGSSGKDDGFVVYHTSINSVVDTHGHTTYEIFDITTTWFREVIWTININGNATEPIDTFGTSWHNVGGDIVDGIQLTKWGRRPEDNDSGASPIAPAQWTATNNGTATFPMTWAYDTSNIPDFTTTLSRFRKLSDIIQFLLDAMYCGLTYRSTFFDNDPLPPEAAPEVEAIITAASGDNYVTEDVNELNYLLVAQKSDVISCLTTAGSGCSASEHATKGMISFNDLSDILYNMFQVYPYIDTEGYLRYEHERFFNKELGTIDLTTQENRYNRELWEKNTTKYKYTTQDLYGKERWDFMEQNYPDFLGETIDYDEILSNTRIDQKVKEYNVKLVTTDLMYMYQVEAGNLEGPISTEGFVILQCSYDGGYTCDNETGALSGVSLPNNHLSVANLQDKYWRWNRIQEYGVMNQDHFNSTETQFESWRRIIEQMELQFNICTDTFDDTKLIKTSLGNGEIYAANYNLSDGIMTVTLRYLP